MLQVLQAEEKYQIRGRIFKNLKKAARLYNFTGFLKSNISSTCTESVLKCFFYFPPPNSEHSKFEFEISHRSSFCTVKNSSYHEMSTKPKRPEKSTIPEKVRYLLC